MSARTERTPIEPELVGTSVGSRHAGYSPGVSQDGFQRIGAIEAMIKVVCGLGIWRLAQVAVIFDAGELSARDTWLGVGPRC